MPRETHNSKHVAIRQYYDKRLREYDSKNTARNEKEYAPQLHMAGREAFYKEYFEDIKLENQELAIIGPFVDIRKTEHFVEGYNRGKFLIEHDIIPAEYQELHNNKKQSR